MKRKPIARGLMAAGLGMMFITACAKTDLPLWHSENTQRNVVPVTNAASSQTVALPDFSRLVDTYGAAVVNISVTGTMKINDAASQLPRMAPDDPFWQFFRRFQVPMQPRDVPVRGLGSGFIVDPDGIILTNSHVVDGAKEVTVKLTDRREFKAKVIGVDKQSDVAVLKITARNLPTVKIGDSDKVKVGAWVVAIGSPYGFENSVTSGIVSAKARALPDDTYVPFLQTDVPVNPGNSGGPLFDLNGDVVGINSQIYSRSGGFQGLSFAIPINIAMQVKDQLLQSGHVTRGRLGVTIQDVSQELADSFGLKKPVGALVSSVDPYGPAAKAGLQAGDVILKIDEKDINQSRDLPIDVADLKPGSTATLRIWHASSGKDVTVTVGELKDNLVASANAGDSGHGRLGLSVRLLTPEEQQEAGVSRGLLVNDASGPAAEAGIQSGDIILGMNGTPITSVEQLQQLVAKAGKHFALLIARDAATIFVPIDLG